MPTGLFIPFDLLRSFVLEHPNHDGPQENEDKTNGENLQLSRHRTYLPILDGQTVPKLSQKAKRDSSLQCEKFFGTIVRMPHQCLRRRLGISQKIYVNLVP